MPQGNLCGRTYDSLTRVFIKEAAAEGSSMTALGNLPMGYSPIQARELTEQFLRSRTDGMKLLDQYEAACRVRRLAARTVPTYKRWVEQFLRFHLCWNGRPSRRAI